MHAHIIPRHREDLPEDEIYRLMESDDADLARAHKQAQEADALNGEVLKRGKFPTVRPDGERLPRTEAQMVAEAQWLAQKLAELEA